MIRLHRGQSPPILQNRGAKETALLWKKFLSGKPLSVKTNVYAHSSVKIALRVAQNNKCAYCETKNPRSHDVVEHYRPKAGCRQVRTESLLQPHYFWLAYEWSNLLFSCDMCNDMGHKQNLFPLNDPLKRATVDNPKTDQEEALLINPYDEDPDSHLEWNADVPRAKNNSIKGAITIEVFGLDVDQTLIDARRALLNVVSTFLQVIEDLDLENPKRDRVKSILMECISDSGEYAAMVRTNFSEQIMSL